MLPELIRFEEEATLIMRTGVQFLDFGLSLDLKKEMPGLFLRSQSNTSLQRLDYDDVSGRYFYPGTRNPAPDRGLEAALDESVRLLEDVWLPIPFLRQHASRFVEGPTNWARARLVSLRPGEDIDGHTHRLVLAVDTKVFRDDDSGDAYLAPVEADVSGGARFSLAWRGNDMGWFSEQTWFADWLAELYTDNAAPRLKLSPEDVEERMGQLEQHAHYLNVLWLLGNRVRLPKIRILSNQPNDVHKAIPVDMVLDVGNSRTCGILIEDHPQENNGLRTRYEMELRDLSRPHLVYGEPFESRVEFAEAVFGKVDHSCHSGRNDAFVWPTIARVGPEAARLASRRRGTEGSTGLSSPKRYLWDEERYEAGWRFNSAFNKAESEPLATAAPFADLINEVGDALFTLPEEEQFQVFIPHYSRSSLMTFMLAEVLTQALCQMNSPGQRMKQSHAHVARQLRSIILTVPPSMPKPERDIFRDRMRQAIGLVWKAMGWHPPEPDIDNEGKGLAWPPLPTFNTQWDEATCAQAVYLFSETVNHFGGRPEEFIQVMRRRRPGPERNALTVASVDIGGGTTDLVVNDYSLDDGRGGNVYILPEQRFRDGFKVAGDDIVLEVLQHMVVPAIAASLREHGVADPEPLLSKLIGAEAGIVQHMVMRHQLGLQVMYPLALRILKDYENYNYQTGAETQTLAIGEILADREPPSRQVLDYFTTGVRGVLGTGSPDFDLLSVPLPIDLNRLHMLFISGRMEICSTIKSLCELVHLYDCDVLLLSGRPSRLPGILALFRALCPLPPDRILPMHNYRTGNWYPFHRQGRIDDPKTTAAVGAMLCVLGQGRIPNFFFRANQFRTYSTVRHIGLMDHNNTIKDADVYYRDVDLDNEEYTLPDTAFEMRGQMILGFRQLAAERWVASPLYMLDFAPDSTKAADKLYGTTNSVLEVTLKRGPRPRSRDRDRGDALAIARVAEKGGGTIGGVRIRLYTLNNAGIGENSYWLDTGSIVR
jgi:hypothetical protein